LVSVSVVVLMGCGGGGGDTQSSISSSLESDEREVELIKLADGSEVHAVKNEILIYLTEDVSVEEYNSIVEKSNEYGNVQGYSINLRTMLVKIKDSVSELDAMDELKKLDGVRDISLNRLLESTRTNKNIKYPYYKKYKIMMKDTSIVSFSGDYWVEHIGLEEAWKVEDSMGTLSNVTLAIADTGIPKDQDLIQESRLTRYDYNGNTISDDNTFSTEDHGSWVTAFATGDKNNTVGVSRYSKVISVDTKIMECKFMIMGICSKKQVSNLQVLQGIETAIDKNADIVNLSAGPTMHCSDESNKPQIRSNFRSGLTSAVLYARRENKMIIFSSGNSCEKHDDTILPKENRYVHTTDAWKTSTIIVGASNIDHTDADFSMMGKAVNILAPGDTVGVNKKIHTDATNSGTSFATPMVAGSAAILKGINGSLVPIEVKQILLDSASRNISFFDMNTSGRVGTIKYSDATGPNLLLNVGKAAKIAKATTTIPMDRYPEIILNKDNVKDVNITVKVPESTVKMLDIVFLIDVSGSYDDDIESLKNSAMDIVNTLKDKEGVDIQFGVSSFSDFPISGYGSLSRGDEAYYINQVITDDNDSITNAINSLNNPLHYGADTPESQLEGLYQVATGEGIDINNDGDYDDLGELKPQAIGWRTGALRVVLFATDANFHDSDTESEYPGHGKAAVINALKEKGIQVIGLQSGDDEEATSDINDIVEATGGTMHELNYDSSEIANAIIEGMDDSLSKISIELNILSGLGWISGMDPLSFEDVLPGQEVTFRVSLKGIKAKPKDEIKTNIYIWAMGNKSAIIKRINIPIKVPN